MQGSRAADDDNASVTGQSEGAASRWGVLGWKHRARITVQYVFHTNMTIAIATIFEALTRHKLTAMLGGDDPHAVIAVFTPHVLSLLRLQSNRDHAGPWGSNRRQASRLPRWWWWQRRRCRRFQGLGRLQPRRRQRRGGRSRERSCLLREPPACRRGVPAGEPGAQERAFQCECEDAAGPIRDCTAATRCRCFCRIDRPPLRMY